MSDKRDWKYAAGDVQPAGDVQEAKERIRVQAINIGEYQNDLRAAKNQIDGLFADKRRLVGDIANLRHHVDATNEELNKARFNLTVANTEIEQLKNANQVISDDRAYWHRSSDNYREALNIRTAEWNKMHSKLNACISELDSVKAQLVVAESQATELQGTIDTWSINAFEDAKTISKHLERIQTLERQVKAEQGARKSAREDYFTCRVDLENLGAEIDRLQVEIQQMKNEQADSAE